MKDIERDGIFLTETRISVKCPKCDRTEYFIVPGLPQYPEELEYLHSLAIRSLSYVVDKKGKPVCCRKCNPKEKKEKAPVAKEIDACDETRQSVDAETNNRGDTPAEQLSSKVSPSENGKTNSRGRKRRSRKAKAD